ncbi:hypothetical protein LV476_01145 [Guyparkeria hydrothermalis]|uniref:hypothetical protein n=1 Tax=Guyparkeria hydrothermalis TaxID=923 RepID=UPI002020D5E7|nr:hypothetical protein [Guyparkeria hydrothermalis]MCL7743556.1 hypothetical protein [Guyparkeria hydrothermalis]
MNNEPRTWPRSSICMRSVSLDVRSIAAEIYRRTCRVNFDEPGFCVVNVGHEVDSVAFRQLMVDLKREMAAIHESATGNTLAYRSAARFDQQETTRPHLDGGPDESLLMLGYEPSEIDSELEIADYAKCAFDLGISPKEFVAEYNPMFKPGYELLRPYTTRVPCFSNTDYQIVCINNSCASYSESQPAWQGTLHTATILTPDETVSRVINSTMIASVPAGTADKIDAGELKDFVSTSALSR